MQKMTSLAKVTVGILVYNGKKYFPYLFPAVLSQNYPNLEILVLDNASSENDEKILEQEYRDKIKIFRTERNLGFAAGHNFLIRKMTGEYYFCLNQDIIIEQNFISRIINLFNLDSRIGAVTGKVKHWDFFKGLDGKTDMIDTTGILAHASHRFTDRGQGEKDCGQYDEETEIFAASGAAVMYRKKALDDISFQPLGTESLQPEYFDELMFMYKEDIDLGYRLRWAGWKCFYTPEAVAYHDRSVRQKKPGILSLVSERAKKSEKVREWSWLHHHILLQKNFSKRFSWKIKWRTFWYEFFTKIFMLLFEPKIFFEVNRELKNTASDIAAKRNKMLKKTSVQEIGKFFI